MATSPEYGVYVSAQSNVSGPSVLSITTPGSTSIEELYVLLYNRLDAIRTMTLLKLPKQDRSVFIDPVPEFVLALSNGQVLEPNSQEPISTIVSELERSKQFPTLLLDMTPLQEDTLSPLESPTSSSATGVTSSLLADGTYPRSRASSSSALTPPPGLQPAKKLTPSTPITLLVKGIKGLEPHAKWPGVAQTINMRARNTIADLFEAIQTRFNLSDEWFYGGGAACPIMVTTLSRKLLDSWSQDSVATLLSPAKHKGDANLVTIFLSARMLGGKGGFGSQLRAAGGRMSSRKNRNQTAEQQNASNRNLDGRRIRTVTEAKNLAAYLTMKPDMDKKEKEERRKRWEAVVEAAERKEEEIKRGKGGNVRLDGQWVEQKEEVEGKTRDAVLAALKAGIIGNEAAMLDRTGSESSDDAAGSEEVEGEASGSSASDSAEETAEASKPAPVSAPATRTFFGWDEDDEDISDDEEDEDDEDEVVPAAYEGKGKGKA